MLLSRSIRQQKVGDDARIGLVAQPRRGRGTRRAGLRARSLVPQPWKGWGTSALWHRFLTGVLPALWHRFVTGDSRRFAQPGSLLVTVSLFAAVLVLGILIPITAYADWPQYGGDVRRSSAAVGAPAHLQSTWSATTDLTGDPFIFEGPSAPAVFDGRVYGYAKQLTNGIFTASKLVAIDATCGDVVFETPLARGQFDSWSAPAVDVIHRTVIIGSGANLYAIDADDGSMVWETSLLRTVVNASALIVGPNNQRRIFITDFDGFGQSASLYCINASAFGAVENPYQPGEIIWTESIGGASGATPTLTDNGLVVLAGINAPTDAPSITNGHISAYDPSASAGNRLAWRFQLSSIGVANEGFFGGVTINDGFVYAASYDINGSGNNSNLVKLDATDGSLAWSVACERSNAIPIVGNNERIYLSAGLDGFGSTPKVQAFDDLGASASLAWDTAVDSGFALSVGGWTHQPVLSGDYLYVGTIPDGFPFFGAYTNLSILNVTLLPSDAGFVVDSASGFGSSPAVCDGRLYSIGASGMFEISVPGDFCGAGAGPDGQLDLLDVPCFVDALLHADVGTFCAAELARHDLNTDGVFDGRDVAALTALLIGGTP